MQVLLIQLLAAFLAGLPLRFNQALGASLGWVAWQLPTRMRNVTRINLELCFPDMAPEARQQLARASLIETGKALTESAWIWKRPLAQLEQRMQDSVGQDLQDHAQANGQGIIYVTPHLGAWELCSLPLTQKASFYYMYRPPRDARIEPQLLRWRNHLRALPARLDPAGIRRVLKELRGGGAIGLLPDQEPDRENGVFAPFFGEPANTMTLLSGLATRGRAQVLFCFVERLPRAAGWRMHYIEPDPDVTHTDRLIAAEAVNRTVERCVQMCPTQYLWNYRRFRLLPDGGRRDYHAS